MDCVVAQRLARKLCERCREAYAPEQAELRQAGLPGAALVPRSASCTGRSGCSACSKTGYRGRIGLYEVMPMTEEIERLTVERASSDRIRTVAIEQGMMTAPRRRAREGRTGTHVHRGGREGGEVTMSDDRARARTTSRYRCPSCSARLLDANGSDLHLTAGRSPSIRVHGDLERLEEYPVAHPAGPPGHDLRDPPAEAAGAARAGARAGHVVFAARPGAVPGQRVLSSATRSARRSG